MGININIATKFDSAGVRSAKRELGTLKRDLSGSVSSLGTNIAILGAGIAGISGYLNRTVNAASNFSAQFEGVNQTFGRGARAVQDYAAQAATLSGISETQALNAAKNFGGFATSAGLSGEAAADFAIELVKAAGDLGSFADVPVEEALAAIQSGLAGQTEPLRNFQILLSDVTLRERAFQMGLIDTTKTALTPQQKVLATHAELMDQMGVKANDFINYSDTYGNQVKSLTAEWANMERAIGDELLPVLEELMPDIRDIAKEFGTTLKNAVKAIDWKALLNDLVAFGTWFVNNVETIAKVTTALFLLNTTVKALNVVFTAGQLILTAYTYVQAKLAAGATIATLAVSGLKAVFMAFAPFAVAAGIAAIAAAMSAVAKDSRLASSGVKSLYQETQSDLIANPWKQAVNPGKVYIGLIRDAKGETSGLKAELLNLPKKVNVDIVLDVQMESRIRNRELQTYLGFLGDRGGITDTGASYKPGSTTTTTKTTAGGSVAQSMSPLQQLLSDPARNIKADKQAVKLEGAGLAKEVAQWITSVDKPVIAAREAMAKIDKRGSTAIANLTKQYQNSSAGRAAASARAAADDAAAIASANALIEAQRAAAAAEAAALAERERVYNSFLDSVKNTFAGIKNAILGAFDLPQLGGSTNSITRNMDKLLVRLRAFAANVKQLAGMGLNPALLQQVISAGPMAGARLAESLVMGGTGALAAINAGYNEFGVLSGQIAETGTNALFNREAQQTVYNINVDGGVGSGSTIGKAIVDAIKAYERTSGAVWQGA
jgi:hypothetical protein